MDHPWPAGLAPAGDDCVITACWYQDEVWREDYIRIGEVLGRIGRMDRDWGSWANYRLRAVSNGIVFNSDWEITLVLAYLYEG